MFFFFKPHKLKTRGFIMFKRIFCFLLLMTTSSAFADVVYLPPEKNHLNNISSIQQYKNFNRNRYNRHFLPNKELCALETYALNKTFQRDTDIQRLERLENIAFGTIQYGDLFSRYQNLEQAILARPKYKTKQRIISNLANYLHGGPTGFTPSLHSNYDNFNNFGGFSAMPSMYSPKYTTTKFEQYSNGIFGGGWGMSNGNFGTGSSIKILD